MKSEIVSLKLANPFTRRQRTSFYISKQTKENLEGTIIKVTNENDKLVLNGGYNIKGRGIS